MKKMKKTTFLAVLFVFLAIVASQIYGAMKHTNTEDEMLSVAMIPEPVQTVQPLPAASSISQTEDDDIEPTIKTTDIADTETGGDAITDVSFSLPSDGKITAPFSDTELSFFPMLSEWRCHLGIDFVSDENDMVFAAAAGTVENVYEDALFGTTVILRHGDDIKSMYASLSEVLVSVGDDVAAGAEIGRMGASAAAETGVHLHFAAERNGIPFDPWKIAA